MRIAFDVKGTIEGPAGKEILEVFKALQALGHTCVIWSNSYSYAVEARKKNALDCEVMDKKSKRDLLEWEQPVFDVAIEDDKMQSYLGANRFVWVQDITTAEALLKTILGE